ncbi:hypothetical protein FACS1894111_06190 [Clostridia bacterium]|nr:hypothetical protein FACS1894111_06190 [Clostridia bacterium]
MYTDKKLSRALKHATLHSFDKDSKYIFFSDIHRGDDSVSDEFARNQTVLLAALEYYYEKGYTYVEAGDGDELWEYPNFKHIRLAHGDIFAVMKKFYDKGQLILIYGNHDIDRKNPSYVKANLYRYYDEYKGAYCNLFPGIVPIEALFLKHKTGGQKLLVVHGHQGDLWNDQLWWFSRLLLRYFWRYLHVVGFRNPASPARNLYKRHKIEKNYKHWILRHHTPLLCGHTHRPRFPREGELPYYNTGCCIHTKGIVGMELTEGKLSMVDWRMKPQADGSLKMERTIVRGPVVF